MTFVGDLQFGYNTRKASPSKIENKGTIEWKISVGLDDKGPEGQTWNYWCHG